MFAVIRTGGKQYRVEPGDVLDVEIVDGKAKVGGRSRSTRCLVYGDGGTRVGNPLIPGAVVEATLMSDVRGPRCGSSSTSAGVSQASETGRTWARQGRRIVPTQSTALGAPRSIRHGAKGQGSVERPRSELAAVGVKAFGVKVNGGSIIVRQRGTRFSPGRTSASAGRHAVRAHRRFVAFQDRGRRGMFVHIRPEQSAT
jgi:ribosomal protein L21/ribosomal protein L27